MGSQLCEKVKICRLGVIARRYAASLSLWPNGFGGSMTFGGSHCIAAAWALFDTAIASTTKVS